MTEQFEFILPNEKKNLYNRFALLIFVLNAIGVTMRIIYSRGSANNSTSIFLLSFAMILLIYTGYLAYFKKVRRYITAFSIAASILSLYWFYLGPWWIGLLSLLLISLYAAAQRELKVEVSEDLIVYPSFPKKNIYWSQLNNLILKDGLLTIDFKSDKIIQHYPQLKMKAFNEQDFNEFCRKQLKKANSEP